MQRKLRMNVFDSYAGIYDQWMRFWHLYKPKTIIENLKPTKKDIILDIGGGTGFIANEVSNRCKKIVVLDSSARMLKQAERYKGKKLLLKKADALSLPYKNNSFDVVLFIDSLHHIKKVDKALKEARRVLKKNGRIIILEFSKESLLGKLLTVFEWIYVEKVRFMKPEELKKECLKAGFKGKIKRTSKLQYLFVGKK